MCEPEIQRSGQGFCRTSRGEGLKHRFRPNRESCRRVVDPDPVQDRPKPNSVPFLILFSFLLALHALYGHRHFGDIPIGTEFCGLYHAYFPYDIGPADDPPEHGVPVAFWRIVSVI